MLTAQGLCLDVGWASRASAKQAPPPGRPYAQVDTLEAQLAAGSLPNAAVLLKVARCELRVKEINDRMARMCVRLVLLRCAEGLVGGGGDAAWSSNGLADCVSRISRQVPAAAGAQHAHQQALRPPRPFRGAAAGDRPRGP